MGYRICFAPSSTIYIFSYKNIVIIPKYMLFVCFSQNQTYFSKNFASVFSKIGWFYAYKMY